MRSGRNARLDLRALDNQLKEVHVSYYLMLQGILAARLFGFIPRIACDIAVLLVRLAECARNYQSCQAGVQRRGTTRIFARLSTRTNTQ